jgi:putative FmdB family regulatory protein
MPLYEYLCETCSRVTETLQRLGEAPMTVCPHCGGPVRKLLSAPAFQFKGEGWYVTDYARKAGAGAGKGDASASETPSSDAPPAAAPASAESKPAPAGDAKKGD